MKRSKALWITLTMAAGLLGLAVGLRGQFSRLVAEHLRRQLDTVPDDRATALLDQAAALGRPGIPVLVEALGSERESVARAGKQALCKELIDWRTLRGESSSPKLAVLAEALAGRVEEFGPTARRDAADLARQILLWPLDPAAVDRSRVIASCEKVLRVTSARSGWPLRSIPADQPSSEAVGMLRRQRPRSDPFPQPAATLANGRNLPGGGLPIRPDLGTGRPPPAVETPRMAEIPTRPPRLLAAPLRVESPNPLRQPDRLLLPPEAPKSMPRSRLPSAGRSPGRVRPLSLDQGGDASPLNHSGDLAGMATFDLMRWLRAESPTTAGRAQTELIRRGFASVHLELARRLFDPDPEARKELARRLPGLQGIEAAGWLLWLCRDADAEVRLIAITLLATTSDPKLSQQVEEMARQDPDPRIRRLGVRLAKGARSRND